MKRFLERIHCDECNKNYYREEIAENATEWIPESCTSHSDKLRDFTIEDEKEV